jgi:hypothetical protein
VHNHDVLRCFLDVKRNGAGWKARCPAHEDRIASLSLGQGRDGRWLLHCHAGCSLEAILAAAQLTAADLFPTTTTPKAKASIVARYPYHAAGGTHLYDMVRFAPKSFRPQRADGAWTMQGVERVLYHLPALQGQSTAYLAEGEKDADRLRAIGWPGTTAPGGAGKWRETYTQQLLAAGVERLAIFPDADAPGQAHAAAVAVSCSAHGLAVKIVTLPDVPPKGDVSDYLDRHSRDELAALIQQTPLYTPAAAPTAPASIPGPTMDLPTILTTLVAFIRGFVVLATEQAQAIALWIVHTYVLDAAAATAYLSISSPVKRSGKSLLLEVLECVAHAPWMTARATAAVLIRKVDAERPTLLLDESDATFKQETEYSEALRGLLNSGYRASGKASLCLGGQGAKITYKDFSTFCPKAIAGIGKLPDTIQDRAIPIILKRRTRTEQVGRFRARQAWAAAAPIREALERWTAPAVLEALRTAEPALPETLNDRAQDVWEPLLAIADLAGGEWPALARKAATTLAGRLEDDDLGIELLHDIKDIFDGPSAADSSSLPSVVSFIASAELVTQLCAQQDRPWATLRKGDKPLSVHGLARLLKQFGIVPRPNKPGEIRGYERDSFMDPWARYPRIRPSDCQNPNNDGPESHFSNRQTDTRTDTSKSEISPITTGLSDDLTVQTRGNGHFGRSDPDQVAGEEVTDDEVQGLF